MITDLVMLIVVFLFSPDLDFELCKQFGLADISRGINSDDWLYTTRNEVKEKEFEIRIQSMFTIKI